MQNNLAIPFSIIVAGALIAGAVFYTNTRSAPTSADQTNQEVQQVTADINPVSADDHVRGNPDAPIMIVEYSDFECPFCKRFHETMQDIMAEYGKDGTVAWVYRQWPIPQLHSKAVQEAEASECVAKLGGNEAFWDFTDIIFDVTPSNDGLDLSKLPVYAAQAGISESAFNTCMENSESEAAVSEDRKEANVYAAAMQQRGNSVGTPHSFVMYDGDIVAEIPGARPYEYVENIIASIIEEYDIR